MDLSGPVRAHFFPGLLTVQELFLTNGPPSIAAGPPGGRHNAVAGDDHGDRIGGAGASDGARRLRLADSAGDLRVGARLAVGNPLQFAPDLPLESGGLNVDW